jgi:hypothetical protein
MIIPKVGRYVVLVLMLLCVLFNSSSAQHFLQLTDEQWIELALDMVRKGIQQQDTTKLFMVFASQVSMKGKSTQPKENLAVDVQAMFDNSSRRKIQIEKPSFPRDDNPLHSSNFWDFDILDPQIKIVGDPAGGGKGDSAIVDCELVLWGAPPVKGPGRGGRRIKETLVFKVPPEVRQPLPPAEYHQWSASGKKEVSRIRSWQLVGFENLFDFLNGEIERIEGRGDEDTDMNRK